MTPQIKVLFVLPSLAIGGAERQVVDLVNELSKDRFNVHLLTFEKELNLLERLDKQRIQIYHVPRRYKFDLKPIRKITQIIEDENIDILHGTNQMALLFGFLGKLKAKKKVKFVLAIHRTFNKSLKNELLDWFLYAPLMMLTDRIIAVGANQRKHWSRKYPLLSSKFVTIHNGIDMKRFEDRLSPEEKSELRKSLGIGKDEFAAGIVANLRVEKGHEYAFRALKTLLNSGKKCRLLIIGSGARQHDLHSLSIQLSISKSIIWLGHQEDPRPFMSICDTLLLPSVAESFSLSILEGLSMGKPVIAFDVSGNSEMIRDGENGYLVKAKDSRTLAEKWQSLIDNRDLLKKFSLYARESVINKFPISEMVMKTELLFETMGSPREQNF